MYIAAADHDYHRAGSATNFVRIGLHLSSSFSFSSLLFVGRGSFLSSAKNPFIPNKAKVISEIKTVTESREEV